MAKINKDILSPVEKKVYDGTFIYTNSDGREIEVKYRSYISLKEMGLCIHSIADSVVDSEFGYFPHLYGVVFYSKLLEIYTDFDTSIGIEEIAKVLYKTNLQNVLENSVLTSQFETIITSVDDLIEFKKKKLATKSEIDSTFTGLLNDLRGLVAKAETFMSLDPDVLGKVVNNLAGMSGITESKLVDALVNTTKNKSGRKAGSKDKVKGNVVELQLPFQQTLENGEIPE